MNDKAAPAGGSNPDLSVPRPQRSLTLPSNTSTGGGKPLIDQDVMLPASVGIPPPEDATKTSSMATPSKSSGAAAPGFEGGSLSPPKKESLLGQTETGGIQNTLVASMLDFQRYFYEHFPELPQETFLLKGGNSAEDGE